MRRRRSERGVALVEVAFAIPVLFLFISGVVDLGMWAFNQNQAANAARDGARMAILDYETADVAGGPTWNAIVERIEARLPGRDLDASDVNIACVGDDGDPVTGGCAAARPGADRIEVTVGWGWRLVTPIAGVIGTEEGLASGTASMVLLGLPIDEGVPSSTTSPSSSTSTSSTSATSSTSTSSSTTSSTTTAPLCNVSGLSAGPVTNKAKNNGALQDHVDVSFLAVGAGCSAITVQVVAPGGGAATRSCGCGSQPSLSWQYDKNANTFWSPGTATVRVLRGASIVATTIFTVT